MLKSNVRCNGFFFKLLFWNAIIIQPWYDLEIIEQYLLFPSKQYNQSERFFDFKILTDYQSFTCVNSVLNIWKVKTFCWDTQRNVDGFILQQMKFTEGKTFQYLR